MILSLPNPPTAPQSLNSDAMIISLAHATEFSRFPSFFLSSAFPPNGYNWGNFKNAEYDALLEKIEKSSDPEDIAANIRKSHELLVDEAVWLFIVRSEERRVGKECRWR